MNKILDRARKTKVGKNWNSIQDDEIEAAVAILKNEVTIHQVTLATDRLSASHAGMSYRLMNALRKGVSEGKVKIEYTNK